jgi:hypothetical protein
MKRTYKTATCALLLSLLAPAQSVAADTGDDTFACMKEQVRPIIQVTDQHQEFDLVIRNECPGDVYWAMCIDRLDPWTHRVIESLAPAGYVKAGARTRVNLQMKAVPDADGDVVRAQEFYYAAAYAINSPTRATCVANRCEPQKQALRADLRENETAWRRYRRSVEARQAAECPEHGWNTDDVSDCRNAIAESAAPELAEFQKVDESLRARMGAIDPETCTVYGGNVLELEKIGN